MNGRATHVSVLYTLALHKALNNVDQFTCCHPSYIHIRSLEEMRNSGGRDTILESDGVDDGCEC